MTLVLILLWCTSFMLVYWVRKCILIIKAAAKYPCRLLCPLPLFFFCDFASLLNMNHTWVDEYFIIVTSYLTSAKGMAVSSD